MRDIYTEAVVTTTVPHRFDIAVRLPFDYNSTTLRPFYVTVCLLLAKASELLS